MKSTRMTAPTTMPSDAFPPDALYARLAREHGHYCPMSTLGLRLGWVALKRSSSADSSMFYQIRTCAVDGLRLLLGDRLQIEDVDRHRLLLGTGEERLSLELSQQSLALAGRYRHLATEKQRQQLLMQLRQLPESQLLSSEQGNLV